MLLILQTGSFLKKDGQKTGTFVFAKIRGPSVYNSSYELIFLKIRAKYEHFFNKNTSKIRAKIRVKLKFLF